MILALETSCDDTCAAVVTRGGEIRSNVVSSQGVHAAFADGELVGYLVCSRYDTVWHIMNVAVDPDRRRQGIAATLLTRLFERVDDPDAQYTLEVRRSNEGAIALYDRFRFRSAGLRRRYYADNGEDALIMWRTPATLRGSLDDVPNATPI